MPVQLTQEEEAELLAASAPLSTAAPARPAALSPEEEAELQRNITLTAEEEAEYQAAVQPASTGPTLADTRYAARLFNQTPAATIKALPDEQALALSRWLEGHEQKALAPSALARADIQELPIEAQERKRTTFERGLDALDFVGRSVARPIATIASVNADKRALAQMTVEERQQWLSAVPLDDRRLDAWSDIVDAMDMLEAKGAGPRQKSLTAAARLIDGDSADVLDGAESRLALVYGTPFTHVDPYSADAARPWSVPARAIDGVETQREGDFVDIALRGLFALDDDDAAAVKEKLVAGTSRGTAVVNSGVRALMSGMFPGSVADDAARFAEAVTGRRDPTEGERLAAEVVLNFGALVAPDAALAKALPAGVRTVASPAGPLTPIGDVTRAAQVVQTQRRVLTEAMGAVEGLTDADKARIAADAEFAVNAAWVKARETAKKAAPDADLSSVDVDNAVVFDPGEVRVVFRPSAVKYATGGGDALTARRTVMQEWVDKSIATIGSMPVVAPVAESVRGLFWKGKARPVAVGDALSGELRPMGAADALSEEKWSLFREALRNKQGFEQELKHRFSEGVQEIFKAAPSTRSRQLLHNLSEVLEVPPGSSDAVKLEALHVALGEELQKTLKLTDGQVERWKQGKARAAGLASGDAAQEALLVQAESAARARLAATDAERAKLQAASEVAAGRKATAEANVTASEARLVELRASSFDTTAIDAARSGLDAAKKAVRDETERLRVAKSAADAAEQAAKAMARAAAKDAPKAPPKVAPLPPGAEEQAAVAAKADEEATAARAAAAEAWRLVKAHDATRDPKAKADVLKSHKAKREELAKEHKRLSEAADVKDVARKDARKALNTATSGAKESASAQAKAVADAAKKAVTDAADAARKVAKERADAVAVAEGVHRNISVKQASSAHEMKVATAEVERAKAALSHAESVKASVPPAPPDAIDASWQKAVDAARETVTTADKRHRELVRAAKKSVPTATKADVTTAESAWKAARTTLERAERLKATEAATLREARDKHAALVRKADSEVRKAKSMLDAAGNRLSIVGTAHAVNTKALAKAKAELDAAVEGIPAQAQKPPPAEMAALTERQRVAEKALTDARAASTAASDALRAAKETARDALTASRGSVTGAVRDVSRATRALTEAESTVKAAQTASDKATAALAKSRADATARAARPHGAENRANAILSTLADAADAKNLAQEESLRELLSVVVDRRVERARMVRDLMTEMTGAATPDEALAFAEARNRIAALLDDVDTAKASVEDAELATLTRGEARQAMRVFEREARGLDVARQFQKLTPQQRKVVEAMRARREAHYNVLVAEGRQPRAKDMVKWLDDMGVEFYAPRQLDFDGLAAVTRKTGRAASRMSERIDSLMKRKHVGATMEQNRAKVAQVGRLLNEDAAAADPAFAAAYAAMDATAKEAADLAAATKAGLDKVRFFREDAALIEATYGQQQARGLANTRLYRQLAMAVPEAEEFTRAFAAAVFKASSKGAGFTVKDVDLRAARAGLRRVNGSTMLREALGIEVEWKGWKDHASAIDAILASGGPNVLEGVLNSLRAAGAPIDKVVGIDEAVKRLVQSPVYLPTAMVDALEDMAKPSFLDGMPVQLRKWMGGAYIAVWKAAMTVMAPAFHGRNALSNAVAGILHEGVHTLSPRNQMDGIRVSTYDDDAMIRIGNVERTAAEWRNLFREKGILTDLTAVLDLAGAAKESRVSVKRALRAGTITGAASGVAASAAEEDDEKKFQAGLAGFLGGAMGGQVLSASADLYGSGARAAYKEAKAAGEPPVRAALNQLFEDALDVKGADSWVHGVQQWIRGSRAVPAAFTQAVLTGAIVGTKATALAATAPIVAQAALGTAALSAMGEAGFAAAAGIGKSIENQARVSTAIAVLRRGGSIDEAARVVDRTYFNYNDLTRFERHAMRTLMPFYTWSSKNVGAQAWLAVNRPERMNVLHKMIVAATNENDDLAWVAPNWRNRLIIQIGRGQVLASSWLPTAAASEFAVRPLREMLSGRPVKAAQYMGQSVNPIALGLLEGLTKSSFYYDKDFADLRDPRDIEALPGPIGDALREWVGYAKKWNPKKGIYEPVIGHYPGSTRGHAQDMLEASYILAAIRQHPTNRILGVIVGALRDQMVSAAAAEGSRSAEKQSEIGRLLGVAGADRIYQQETPTLGELLNRRMNALRQVSAEAGTASKWPRMESRPDYFEAQPAE